MSKTAVTLLSGGMDSATLLYLLASEDCNPIHALSFNYGQRHKKELEYARGLTTKLAHDSKITVTHEVVDLSSLRSLLAGSALTSDDVDVPEGHYASENMKLTVVPNRNSIMLAVAYGVAVSRGASVIAAGMHAGDHPVYPDCRPQFVRAFADAEYLANQGFADPNLKLHTPFINITKADIVMLGAKMGVPFDLTWSCYKGETYHCGRCATCIERREAFHLAKVEDPTKYYDTEYWKEVVGLASS